MSVNKTNESKIGDMSELEEVGFESEQLLKDIEKEFATLKDQEAAICAEDQTESSSTGKGEWVWNVVAVLIFAVIGFGGEKIYQVLKNKKIDIPEHIQSLQDEEDVFADDVSHTEKAMHLRNALQAQMVENDDEVSRMMDEDLDSYHDAEPIVIKSKSLSQQNLETSETKQVQNITKVTRPEETKVANVKKVEPTKTVRATKNENQLIKDHKRKAKLKVIKKITKNKIVKKSRPRKKTIQEAKPKFTRYMVVQGKSHLRRGPASKYESVKLVKIGTTFLAESYDKTWVKVDFGQYIEKSRLYNLDSKDKSGFKTSWIKTKKLNVRSRATIQSKVLKTLLKADKVKTLKISKKWSALADGGFIYNKYLSRKQVYPFDLPTVMSVAVGRANIREEPSTNAKAVGQYFKGKPLKVHSIDNGWAKVGKYQYISVELLKLVEMKTMNIAKKKRRSKR